MTDSPATPTQDDFDQAIRTARLAADDVAMRSTGTGAQRTAAIVKRALGTLLSNGIATITPRDTWPEWIEIDRHHPFEGEQP